MIKPFQRAPSKRTLEKWNHPIAALAKGMFADSPDIIWRKLPDGRQQPFLTPAARARLYPAVTSDE